MGWRDRVRAVTAHLRATWVPSRARHYRRPGGPWQVPTLDALLYRRYGRRGASTGRPGFGGAGRGVGGLGGRRPARPGRAPRVSPWPGRCPTAWPPPCSAGPAGGWGRWRRRCCTRSAPPTWRRRWPRSSPRLVVELAPEALSDPAGARGGAGRPAGGGRVEWRAALGRGPGVVHLGLDRGAQGGAAHAPRPQLEGVAHGAGARARRRRCRAHAGADGAHFGHAQRCAGAGRGRMRAGAGPALRRRAGAVAGGRRAHLVPGRAADVLRRHGDGAAAGAAVRGGGGGAMSRRFG